VLAFVVLVFCVGRSLHTPTDPPPAADPDILSVNQRSNGRLSIHTRVSGLPAINKAKSLTTKRGGSSFKLTTPTLANFVMIKEGKWMKQQLRRLSMMLTKPAEEVSDAKAGDDVDADPVELKGDCQDIVLVEGQ
jgi:hypothetical protein